MALIAGIYRGHRGDFSNGGISARTEQVVIDNAATGHEPNTEAYARVPHVTIVERTFGNRTVYHAEPVEQREGGFYLNGGTFIFSHDSRFAEAIGGMYAAIALHDRFEEYS